MNIKGEERYAEAQAELEDIGLQASQEPDYSLPERWVTIDHARKIFKKAARRADAGKKPIKEIIHIDPISFFSSSCPNFEGIDI